jgi:hypothetical protein
MTLLWTVCRVANEPLGRTGSLSTYAHSSQLVCLHIEMNDLIECLEYCSGDLGTFIEGLPSSCHHLTLVTPRLDHSVSYQFRIVTKSSPVFSRIFFLQGDNGRHGSLWYLETDPANENNLAKPKLGPHRIAPSPHLYE